VSDLVGSYWASTNVVQTSEVLGWRSWDLGQPGDAVLTQRWLDAGLAEFLTTRVPDTIGGPVRQLSEWRLRSPLHSVLWDGPVMVADAVPRVGNCNGIYALKRPTRHTRRAYWNVVVGVVALSGQIVVGKYGYRAERAVVRALWLDHSLYQPDIIQALQDCYQADVHCQGFWTHWQIRRALRSPV